MRSVSVTTCCQLSASACFSMPVCRNPMSASAWRMISPSSSRMMRSTPWVDGCCGPMFRTMRRDVAGAASCSDSPVAAVLIPRSLMLASGWTFVSRLLLVLIRVLVAVDRKISAQRVSFPFFWQQDPLQIGMPLKPDSEQVVHFPLVPVGAFPDRSDTRQRRIGAGQGDLQFQTDILRNRVQQVEHFKARLQRIPVN